MKIVHILGGLNRGGIENFIYNHFKELLNDYELHLIVFSTDADAMKDQFLQLGCKIHYTKPLRDQGIILYIKNLYKIIKRIKPKVLHSHSMHKAGIDCMIGFFAGAKVRIAHSHNTKHEFENKFSNKIVLNIFKLILHLFSNKKLACGEEAGYYLFGKKSKFTIFQNAISINKFLFNRQTFDTVIKNVLFIGRLNTQKNPLFCLKIVKSYIDNYGNNIKLTIIGEGVKYKEMNDYIIKYNLQDNIDFLGSVNNVDEILKNNDYLIMPSLYEGLPVALIESQISGIECIVSDTVTREVNLEIGNISFLPIQDENEWSKFINNNVPTLPHLEEIVNNPNVKLYDVKISSKRLKDIYEK